MKRQLLVDLVERLPQGMLSRAWGWVARRQHPRVGVAVLKRFFVQAAGVDMSEAESPVGDYATLEELFVRRLRPGARRVESEPTAFVSPVDGVVGASGKVEHGTLLQIKGREYGLARLLDDAGEAARFEGGDYTTLYLSPRDYHRVHAPVSGQVADAVLVPGGLLPVFDEAVASVDELFTRNERVVTYLDNPDAGRVAVVKVGATLVGRIRLAYDATVRTNRAGQLRRHLRYDPPHLLTKGAELGAFEMGSTVVVITEPGRVELSRLDPGATVQWGQQIGTVTGPPRRPKAPVRRTASKKKASKKKTTRRRQPRKKTGTPA
jgi:phosphatidylserine decarboxylase